MAARLIVVFLACVGCLAAQTPAAPRTEVIERGRRLYDAQCALCHGIGGKGGRGPDLTRPALKNAPDEAALRSVIERGIPNSEMPGAWQMHPREIDAVTAYVLALSRWVPEKVPGVAARGAAIYDARGCATCHAIDGRGSGFGPELTGIGTRRGAAYLRESLTRPEAAFPDRFLYVEAITSANRKIRGIRMNEDSFTIQIKDSAENFHSFRKGGLKELRRLAEQSPMPAYGQLGSADLDDLVAYLAGLKGKP